MKNRKSTHHLVTALLGVVCLAQSAFTFAADGSDQAPAVTLPTVTRANIKAEVIKADRPSLLLVCSSKPVNASCAPNEAALAAQAAAHPEVKVVKILSEENGIRTGLYTYVPGSGLTFQQPNFDAAKVDEAFYSRRVELAVKEAAAVKDYQAVAARVKEATKVADEKLAALAAEDDKAFEAMSAQADKVRAAQEADPAIIKLSRKRAAQAAPFDKRIAALRQQIQQQSLKKSRATAATDKELELLKDVYRAQRAALQAAYSEQERTMSPSIVAAQKERKAAAEPFDKELTAASAALQALLEADKPAN